MYIPILHPYGDASTGVVILSHRVVNKFLLITDNIAGISNVSTSAQPFQNFPKISGWPLLVD